MSQDLLMQQVPMMMDESLVNQQNKALLILPMVTAPAYNPKEFRCQLTLQQIQSIASRYYPTSIEPANEDERVTGENTQKMSATIQDQLETLSSSFSAEIRTQVDEPVDLAIIDDAELSYSGEFKELTDHSMSSTPKKQLIETELMIEKVAHHYIPFSRCHRTRHDCALRLKVNNRIHLNMLIGSKKVSLLSKPDWEELGRPKLRTVERNLEDPAHGDIPARGRLMGECNLDLKIERGTRRVKFYVSGMIGEFSVLSSDWVLTNVEADLDDLFGTSYHCEKLHEFCNGYVVRELPEKKSDGIMERIWCWC